MDRSQQAWQNGEIDGSIPRPDVMPVDREAWAKELSLSNFVNAYYQYRDLESLGREIRDVLIVGPGQGLDREVLRWRGYRIVTLDIDETFGPDFVGSVHDLSRFGDGQFDAAIASHVLEHQAEPWLGRSLGELARVARFALVYLPVAGRHFQLRLKLDVRGIDRSWIFDLFNWFERPSSSKPLYCQGQHFWEVGRKGFRQKDLIRRFEREFRILSHYRNHDWNPSMNFVLASRRHSP